MKALSIVMRVIVTLAAVLAGWSMATAKEQPTPHWLIWPIEGLLALAWGIVFWKLSSVVKGLWALILLLALVTGLAAVCSFSSPDGLPDWTVLPIFGTAIIIWALGARFPAFGQALKNVGRAVLWLVSLMVPAAVLTSVLSSFVSDEWIGRSTLGQIFCAAAAIGIVAVVVAMFWVWIIAIKRRWSLKWPFLFWGIALVPFGLLAITAIGFGKLIIWWVGRGSTVASSGLREPAAAVVPCSILESTSNDW